MDAAETIPKWLCSFMIGLATPFRIAFRIWTNEAAGVRAVREEKRRRNKIREEKESEERR